MLQTWRVSLERLRVNIPDEGGLLSDGDEPQLAIIPFLSTFRQPGSTKVWRQPFDSGLWPEGVDAGDEIAIPVSVGVFEYPPITNDPPGINVCVFGFVVAAFDRDATPQALIRDKLDDIVEALHAGLARLVEGGSLSLRPEERQEQIEELRREVEAAGEFSTIEELGIFVGSAFDSDDEIGSVQVIFTNRAGEPTSAAPQPLSLDLVRRRSHPLIPDVELVTASYTVTGRIDIAFEEVEHEFVPETGDPRCRPHGWPQVSLPELIQAVKDGRQVQIEVKLDDTVHPQRTAFGTSLVYHPGEDRPGNGPFIPAGHYGEKITMDTVECRDGYPTAHRWRTQLLLSTDSDSSFGSSSYPSLLIYIDDVNVYYQPLQQVGSHWEGSDPGGRIQVFSRRYEPPR